MYRDFAAMTAGWTNREINLRDAVEYAAQDRWGKDTHVYCQPEHDSISGDEAGRYEAWAQVGEWNRVTNYNTGSTPRYALAALLDEVIDY